MFPNDIPNSEWNPDNLRMWSEPRVAGQYGLSLIPLQAKALHVIGTVVQIFNAAGHLLYAGKDARPYADYCLYTYMIACTAIELLGRSQTGEQNCCRSTLKEGLRIVGLDPVPVNIRRNGVMTDYTYDVSKLDALRNLVAHGQAIASAKHKRTEVMFHVELLDTFPAKLITAFDAYYEGLFLSSDLTMRRNLARAAVEPVLYMEDMGQVPYIHPIKYAYDLILEGKKPSQGLRYTDWQLYNPARDIR